MGYLVNSEDWSEDLKEVASMEKLNTSRHWDVSKSFEDDF